MEIKRWSSKIYGALDTIHRWTIPSQESFALRQLGYDPKTSWNTRQKVIEELAVSDGCVSDQLASLVAKIYLHERYEPTRAIVHSMLDSYAKTGDFSFSIPHKQRVATYRREHS